LSRPLLAYTSQLVEQLNEQPNEQPNEQSNPKINELRRRYTALLDESGEATVKLPNSQRMYIAYGHHDITLDQAMEACVAVLEIFEPGERYCLTTDGRKLRCWLVSSL